MNLATYAAKQLVLMVDLLNALKLSFKKPSSTTALKRQLLGLKHVASDKPQNTLLKRRRLQHLTDIRSFIEEMWKNKNSTNFL